MGLQVSKSDISFVVQGPILKDLTIPNNTQAVLKALRKNFLGAQIILSTWKGSDTSELDYDVLVLSDDPHLNANRVSKFNINRQLVSTKSGLKRTNRRFVAKTRTDLLINSDNFLNIYNDNLEIKKPTFFQFPVLITSLFSKKYIKLHSVALHFSDWFHFGMSEDIKKLWDIPLTDEPEFSNFQNNSSLPLQLRFSPEQYPWINALKADLPSTFTNLFSFNKEISSFEFDLLVNNIIFCENSKINLVMEKYSQQGRLFKASLFDNTDLKLINKNWKKIFMFRRSFKRLIRF